MEESDQEEEFNEINGLESFEAFSADAESTFEIRNAARNEVLSKLSENFQLLKALKEDFLELQKSLLESARQMRSLDNNFDLSEIKQQLLHVISKHKEVSLQEAALKNTLHELRNLDLMVNGSEFKFPDVKDLLEKNLKHLQSEKRKSGISLDMNDLTESEIFMKWRSEFGIEDEDLDFNDGIAAIDSNVSDYGTCPFLLVEIKEAVQNKNCKHYYSKEGIENCLKNHDEQQRKFSKKLSCACPHQGCKAKVSRNSLVYI